MTHSLKVAMMQKPAFYWKAACDFGPKGFTVAQLAGCTCGVAYSTVYNWVRCMSKQGELIVVGSEPSYAGRKKYIYAVRKPRAKAPVIRRPDYDGSKFGRSQENLWQTMRMLKDSWTVEELALAASTEETPVQRATAKQYVIQLIRVGIVQVVKERSWSQKGCVAGRYRLSRAANSGPLPPKVLEAKFVYDQNRQKIIGESEVRNGLV